MVDKVENLQSIIEKEASANTYYYNYPPKPDYSLVFAETKKVSSAKKGGEMSELAKLKQIYENMMEVMKKNHHKEVKEMKQSYAEEVEHLQELYTKTSKQLMTKTHELEELDKKFKMYFLKSDKYIKEREDTINNLQDECQRLADEYGRFDQMFATERNKSNEC